MAFCPLLPKIRYFGLFKSKISIWGFKKIAIGFDINLFSLVQNFMKFMKIQWTSLIIALRDQHEVTTITDGSYVRQYFCKIVIKHIDLF